MSHAPALVLCMAGLYRRFRDAGYTTPKYLLPYRGGTVLSVIASELRSEMSILVANERDRAHEAQIRAAVPDTARLLWIGDTSGQAETAAIGVRALSALGWTGSLLLHNVDTVLVGRDLSRIGAILARADGFVDVFRSDSPAFSYVAVEGTRVVDIAEKVVISPHATTGLYGFGSCEVYLDACGRTSGRSKAEFYVSDVYRTMLADGRRIEIDPPGPDQDTIVLGTPAEYEAEVARQER